jgi:hypothetical protein
MDDAREGLSAFAGLNGSHAAVRNRMQADGVALRVCEIGKRGRENACAVELSHSSARAGAVFVAHRLRSIEDDPHRHGGLDFALAKIVAIERAKSFQSMCRGSSPGM